MYIFKSHSTKSLKIKKAQDVKVTSSSRKTSDIPATYRDLELWSEQVKNHIKVYRRLFLGFRLVDFLILSILILHLLELVKIQGKIKIHKKTYFDKKWNYFEGR